jgi:hypothetical protein
VTAPTPEALTVVLSLVAVAVPPGFGEVADVELVEPAGGAGAVGTGVPTVKNETVGDIEVIKAAAMWPVIVAVPVAVPEVKVPVYVPFPLSVAVGVIVPKEVARVTTLPPAVRLLPFASLAWTVMVAVAPPPARIAVGLAEMAVVTTLIGPGVKETVGDVEVIKAAAMWPVIVAVPVAVPVSIAV